MSKLNGHGSNGSGGDRPNVASLDEARRRAAEKAKAEKRAQSGGAVRAGAGPRTSRDWLIGGLIVVMAVGYIASFFIGTEPVTTGGAP